MWWMLVWTMLGIALVVGIGYNVAAAVVSRRRTEAQSTAFKRRYGPFSMAVCGGFGMATLLLGSCLDTLEDASHHERAMSACTARCAPLAAVACDRLNRGPEENAKPKQEYSVCLTPDGGHEVKLGERR